MTSAAAAVPADIDGVDSRWLSTALGTPVDAVRSERIAQDTGFSSLLYRLHLTGTGVPATLIAKLPAQSDARGAMDLMGGYRRELAFYRDVAGRAPLATPRAYVAATADDGADFVLLLEDLADWDNADHLAGLSMDRARTCIAQLAGLHAWSGEPANTAVVQTFPSIDTPIVRDLMLPAFAPGWQLYRERTEATVPARFAAFADRFAEHAATALTALSRQDRLIHGDIRADNMFFRDDAMKVVDFQFVARGCGVSDIAYLVTQGLPEATRAGHDEALVREYLDRLVDAGAEPADFDEVWLAYRQAAVFLTLMPVVALLAWDAVPERSRLLCLTLVDRAIAAIDEIDALEVFP